MNSRPITVDYRENSSVCPYTPLTNAVGGVDRPNSDFIVTLAVTLTCMVRPSRSPSSDTFQIVITLPCRYP